MGQWARTLLAAGCSETVMVGRVQKRQMYDRWRYLRYIPDLQTIRFFWRHVRRDKRPQAILQAMIAELARAGINLVDSTPYCPEHVAMPGVMTRRQPTDLQWQDIRLGYQVAQSIRRFDIGQSLAVFHRDVIAVEALEGTDAMIERAGQLCRIGGWTMVKVANAEQDMRVDIPTVGPTTIEKLAAARAACLVLEPGKTVMLEKPKVLELAERYRITIVGHESHCAPV